MSVIAVESQISIFLRKYTPAVEAQLREARTRLRAMFPRGFELVYDNYNALVFGISPTERTSDAVTSDPFGATRTVFRKSSRPINQRDQVHT